MAINPIDQSTSLQLAKEIKKKMSPSDGIRADDTPSVQNTSDKVDLSPEAKKLHEAQVQSKLSDIRGKIDSGFYNSDDVLGSVATSIIKVIRNA